MHDPTPGPEPETRTSRLRTTALASAVALVLALPLAFVAGGPAGFTGMLSPASEQRDGSSGGAGDPDGTDDAGDRDPSLAGAAAPERGAGHSAPEPGQGANPEGSARLPGGGSPAGAFCGPELSAPEGVEAQTCVLTEGADTWGRLYYRNQTGQPLRGELTVHRPDGEQVVVTCDLPASDEPGLCETPREPTVAGPADTGPVDYGTDADPDRPTDPDRPSGPLDAPPGSSADVSSTAPSGPADSRSDDTSAGDRGSWENGAQGGADAAAPRSPETAQDELYSAVAELTDPAAEGEPLLRAGSGRG